MAHIILDAAKSTSARTEWRIGDDGCLTETSPQSAQFTLSAMDTKILLDLLQRNEDTISTGAARERQAFKHVQQQNPQATLPADMQEVRNAPDMFVTPESQIEPLSETQKGDTRPIEKKEASSVTLDEGLRGKGTTIIHATRGA